jgi:hypothetical protein
VLTLELRYYYEIGDQDDKQVDAMASENSLTTLHTLHGDLLIIKELLYDKCGFDFIHPKIEVESIEYGACSFRLNENSIKHRVSKITPTKTGQFVTIWKRNISGVTAPFDDADDIDFFIITSRKGNSIGQFIFPKNVLVEKGVVSKHNKIGNVGLEYILLGIM